MKRVLLASTIAVTAFAGAASAMTVANDVATAKIQKIVPDADLSGYSDAAIINILNVIDADSNEDVSNVQLKAKVQSLLNHLQ